MWHRECQKKEEDGANRGRVFKKKIKTEEKQQEMTQVYT